ncbi:hypothetical protein M409DRAFT_52011 [Zasmidium cellare ATCC 36951]|uniref:CCHC-type domain-containing protein n=1 Tax=Zasmidium cellare ATCC 36951 TaxID=1080233 RepID=A0A6A6CT83_ZASCE|nr:uncharacterized protein M409DRAFT_52011 [Zasmidium cellare ATCC 36951]KAF2170275.1 hypothetical protein M409DRAFT_52011 [Zasmidium cellare ATCC 36951]
MSNNNRGSSKRSQNNNQKKSFNCATHGPNSTHNTKDCKTANNTTAQKKTCALCGKIGHLKKDCRLDPNSQKAAQQTPAVPTYSTNNNPRAKKTSTSPQSPSKTGKPWSPTPTWVAMDLDESNPTSEVAAIPYCAWCNTIGHKSGECQNGAAMAACHVSCLHCCKCNMKGHLSSECRNPLFRECHKCHSQGHTEPLWPTLLRGPKAQDMRDQWNEYQRKAQAEGIVIDEDFRINTEREICETAAYEIGLGMTSVEPEPLRSISRRGSRPRAALAAQSVAKAKVTKCPLQNVPTFNSTFTFDRKTIKQMRALGLDINVIKAIEEAQHQKVEANQSQHQKALRKKIDASKTYPKSCVSTAIRTQELWVLENNLLTRGRMDAVKMELSQGSHIWRDPGAIAALIQRQQPCCDSCQRPGGIYDKHFNRISPIISEEDILKLEDWTNEGLFVALRCPCCVREGYTWTDIPQAELVRLEEEQEAKANGQK